jgi:ATP-dependent exoDNAse (exonuclease V) alpha subunit
MAIYHLSVKPVSRGAGRSATAAAAYRAAERIEDHTTGQVFDYTRKSGVEHAEIVLPVEAAKRDINWARDRQQLWNAAEVAEKRKDARVAREYEVALPNELTKAQRLELTRAFSQELANRFGCAVDFAVHRPHREGDERNFHAHILTTTRQVEATGLGAKTSIEWADTDRAKQGLGAAKQEVTAIRERWAVLANEKLQALGLESRIDHRSLDAQGEQRIPGQHLGPSVTAIERRGERSEVGWRVREEADERLRLAAELGRIERERQAVERSILDLTGDIQGARRDRDASLAPGYDLEHERQAGREAWLAWRANRQDQLEREPQTPTKPPRLVTPDDDFAM